MSVIEEAWWSLPGPVFEALYEARQPSEGMGLFNTSRLIADEEIEEDPTWRRVRLGYGRVRHHAEATTRSAH